mmetsp:Transcript_121884/g.351917  ORF Transcript_121884/g.351917 Transcript_121884/m.351917 type:complete len:514 (+) Transcript_121884:92-1633(+)|eukprot:CAMPEP_0176010298 /NCGR_PEP_ID=MMETSP0120_2-20121206/4696_1 /TAXON_ID=160619 /ORGANISM="Kryptoperidinium foliaceum, Strain CCMP 1326" /LENGTH=513 /DNA_ID=CAMNT_0017343125 /DNA_START=77 /DNA_END=1618 /DNA_ORIENTATION=+
MRFITRFLNGSSSTGTEVEEKDFDSVDKDANKTVKVKKRKAPTLRDIPRLTKEMVQMEREDPAVATAAAKQLYELCDVAHKSNREPMVATGKYDVLNPLADCLLQNNDEKLHYVCLTLNNLSIPHENKRVMALERIHKKLFANLCHVISTGKKEAYLCLICLTNLSFYEPAQVSIGQYSPRQSTSLRAPKLPPLENPSSMLRILQDVTAHAAKGTKDYRWAFGLLASLARHSENALLIGLTAIPGLALENIRESKIPSEKWSENSLEDFCLFLIMRLSEVSSQGLGDHALEVMQPIMVNDSGIQGLKATIVCAFLDAPWSTYPNYGVVAAGSVAELMGNAFERKGKKNVYEGNAFVLKTAVGAYAALARAAALADENSEDHDFSNTKVVALPTAVAVIFQIIHEIVAHWGEEDSENEFDFHYDLAAGEKAVSALKSLLPALLVREKLPRPSKHTENVCFELSQLLVGFSSKASTIAAKSSSKDIGAKIYEAMQSGLPVLEASYDLWKVGMIKT